MTKLVVLAIFCLVFASSLTEHTHSKRHRGHASNRAGSDNATVAAPSASASPAPAPAPAPAPPNSTIAPATTPTPCAVTNLIFVRVSLINIIFANIKASPLKLDILFVFLFSGALNSAGDFDVLFGATNATASPELQATLERNFQVVAGGGNEIEVSYGLGALIAANVSFSITSTTGLIAMQAAPGTTKVTVQAFVTFFIKYVTSVRPGLSKAVTNTLTAVGSAFGFTFSYHNSASGAAGDTGSAKPTAAPAASSGNASVVPPAPTVSPEVKPGNISVVPPTTSAPPIAPSVPTIPVGFNIGGSAGGGFNIGGLGGLEGFLRRSQSQHGERLSHQHHNRGHNQRHGQSGHTEHRNHQVSNSHDDEEHNSRHQVHTDHNQGVNSHHDRSNHDAHHLDEERNSRHQK